MNNSIDQLLRSPVSFLADSGPEEDIALSSRIRLARNLAGRPFPAAASLESRQEVCELVSQAAAGSGVLGCPDCYSFDPAEMSPLDREILFERRLASRDFLERDGGTRLLVRADESSSIMVNEEDQLRIQTLRPGFQLDEVWRVINALDDELSAKLDCAFDDKLGYLTSCPTNVGTGMRASVMLHLPGLVLSGQIGPTIQGVAKLNLAVRGIFGEGTDNRGNLYQVSNQSTLGESETQIIERLNTVISQLIAQEKIARQQLILRDRFALLDHVGRSYGILRHAYRITTEEALNSLSGIRIGVDLGMFNTVDIKMVNELFLAINPAHLQKRAGKELSAPERDICRAALCRDKLKGISAV